jgi:hypothetical protein
MCGAPLPWWQEELNKDKKQQEEQSPIPSTPAEENTEECD